MKYLTTGLASLPAAGLADVGCSMMEGYTGMGGGMFFGAMFVWLAVAAGIFSVLFWLSYKMIVQDAPKKKK